MQNKYWKISLTLFTARTPNTQVKPSVKKIQVIRLIFWRPVAFRLAVMPWPDFSRPCMIRTKEMKLMRMVRTTGPTNVPKNATPLKMQLWRKYKKRNVTVGYLRPTKPWLTYTSIVNFSQLKVDLRGILTHILGSLKHCFSSWAIESTMNSIEW